MKSPLMFYYTCQLIFHIIIIYLLFRIYKKKQQQTIKFYGALKALLILCISIGTFDFFVNWLFLLYGDLSDIKSASYYIIVSVTACVLCIDGFYAALNNQTQSLDKVNKK